MRKQFRGQRKEKQARLSLSNARPELRVSFTAGALSPLGGLPVLAKVVKIAGLIEGAASRLSDHRTQGLIDYNKFQLLRQCVLLCATGNSDTNDADKFRLDPALIEGLELKEGEFPASQKTISRFLNDITQSDLDELADWLLEFYIRNHPVRRKQIYLYADGTAVETHGKQEKATYRGGKYKKEMLFPLVIFDDQGWLLSCLLRAGYDAEAKTILPEVEKIVARLREHWPQVEIVLVVDGAFKSSELLNWCEKNKVFYLAGYANTHAVKVKAKPDANLIAKKFKKEHGEPRFTGKDGNKKAQEEHTRIRDIEDSGKRRDEERKLAKRRVRRVVEDTHRASSWPKTDPERRLIIRLDFTDKGLETRSVLTNLVSFTAETIYDMYCQRGASENWIGAFKDCGRLRFNSQQFRANHMRLYVHGLAYMALFLFRRRCSAVYQQMSLERIKSTFIEVPVLATYRSTRTTLWEMSDRYQQQVEFLRIVRKLEKAS